MDHVRDDKLLDKIGHGSASRSALAPLLQATGYVDGMKTDVKVNQVLGNKKKKGNIQGEGWLSRPITTQEP